MAKVMTGRVQAPGRLRKTAPTSGTGVITVIAAVTGTVDHVQDIILPGAFMRTLRARRPKAVQHHDWTAMVGSIPYIVELMPGDPRLPKRLQDGRPWPVEAGALVATLRFNLRVQAGRDAYEWAKFFHETSEGAWSIGYKVVVGKSYKRKDGVRVIVDLDLFEVSQVLHAAHGDTMTLEVKGLDGGDGISVLETKDAPVVKGMRPAAWAVLQAKAHSAGHDETTVRVGGLAVVAEDTGRVLMLQRALTMNDPAAGTWEFPGGHLDAGESPAAAAIREWKEETGLHLPGGELTGEWTSPNGVYRGHVYAIKREADVLLNPNHDDRVTANPDDPTGALPEVTAWWHITDLPGMTALRPEVNDTDWAVLGKAAGGKAEHALQGKSMYAGSAGDLTVPALGRRQRTGPIRRGPGGAHLAVKAARRPPSPDLETKMHPMTGSYEQRHDALRSAVTELFDKDTAPGEACLVCIEATYDDHLIVTVEEPGEQACSYEVPYTLDGQGLVELGAPSKTDIVVMAVPAAEEVVDTEAAEARFYGPAIGMLADATALIGLGAEGKVLDARLRMPMLRLLDQLASKGMTFDDDDDPLADATLAEDDPWAGLEDPAMTADRPPSPALDAAPAAPAYEDEGKDEDEDEDMVTLDPDEVAAELAAMRA